MPNTGAAGHVKRPVGRFNEDLHQLYAADVRITFDVNLRTAVRRKTCNLALEQRERELVPAR